MSYNALFQGIIVLLVWPEANNGIIRVCTGWCTVPGCTHHVHHPGYTPRYTVHCPATRLHAGNGTAQEWATGLEASSAYLARRPGPSVYVRQHESTAS